MKKKKERGEFLFSVTKNQLKWEFFRCSGAGGQNVNKRDTGARVRHEPSGAVAESCKHREQHKNRVEALRKLANSKEFRTWAFLYNCDLNKKVNEQMSEENLRIEYGV